MRMRPGGLFPGRCLAGGMTIPGTIQQETERRTRAYAEKRYAGTFTRLGPAKNPE